MFLGMYTLIAASFIASLSLIGIFFFGKTGRLVGTHRYIVPFAIGAFLAITFFELIPETLEASPSYGAVAIVIGFLLFYLLSNLLSTYHHHHDEHGHDDHCAATKVSASMLLLGDTVHNFTDGIVLATAFFVNPTIGFVTTLGVALHEIPQEIAEYGVLLKSGYTPKKALLLNFISALGVVIGAILSLFFMSFLGDYVWILTGLAAGNLLYVATSDLLPGVHRESHVHGTFLGAFLVTLMGVVLVGGLILFGHNIA